MFCFLIFFFLSKLEKSVGKFFFSGKNLENLVWFCFFYMSKRLQKTSSVFAFSVFNLTSAPLRGTSSPSDQSTRRLETKLKGVQESKFAFGMAKLGFFFLLWKKINLIFYFWNNKIQKKKKKKSINIYFFLIWM